MKGGGEEGQREGGVQMEERSMKGGRRGGAEGGRGGDGGEEG